MTTAAAKIEALLKDAMGLDVASIGSVSVERAVRVRAAALGAASTEAYWDRIKGSRTELQELIEIVVVPETWFSRDREALVELTRVAREEWRANRPAANRRLLSLPCSTGEEPYSMAMAMLDAGFAPERFTIDAIDISERSLTVARRGIYGRNSFRGSELAFRDRYFETVPDGQRVNDTVRRSVRLRHGNVLAADFIADGEPYDAIFCRNLLIYFDDDTQDRTIAKLRGMLNDDGLLFVGPAEASALLDHELVSAKVPLAFAFRKSPPPALTNAPSAATRSRERPRLVQRAAPARPTTTPAREPALPPLPASAPITQATLDAAFALADRGQLAEATTLCEQHLRVHGPSASAFYLMGLICNADGRLAQADKFYRKALFLDKNHHDALVHLALLLERQGDEHSAKLLRGRAQRL